MISRLYRNAAHGQSNAAFKAHIVEMEKNLIEAQKEWDKGPKISAFHIFGILGLIGSIYAINKAKNNKEHVITQYIAHKMTSNQVNSDKSKEVFLTQQLKSENRLLKQKLDRVVVVQNDPYINDRNSPF